MGKGSPLQLFLAFRLYGGSADEICARAEPVLRALPPGAETPPLYWNFAASSLLASSSRPLRSLVLAIQKRCTAGADGILPAGFVGAAHTCLTEKELERELTWCFKNPWFAGLGEVFGSSPQAALPFRADALREAACGAYSSAGYRLLGLPVGLEAALPERRSGLGRQSPLAGGLAQLARLRGLGEGRARLLPAVLLRSLAEVQLLLRRAAVLGGQGARLLLLLDAQAGAEAAVPEMVRRLLSGLKAVHALSFPRLEQACAAPAAEPAALSALVLAAESTAGPPPQAPEGREARLRTAKRRTHAEQRSLLERLRALPGPGGAPPGGGAAPAGRRRPQIVMSASMSGLITLAGSAYDATFAEGRLSGFSVAGRQVLGGRASRAYLRLGAREIALQTESAFSFERDGERGVHTELTALLPPGPSRARLHLNAYFREAEEPLSIEAGLELSDPADAGRLSALVPLELSLPLSRSGALPRLEAQLDGEGLYRESFAFGEGLVYGRRIRIALEGAVLVVEHPDAARVGHPGVICVRLRRRPSRRPLLQIGLTGGLTALSVRLGLVQGGHAPG